MGLEGGRKEIGRPVQEAGKSPGTRPMQLDYTTSIRWNIFAQGTRDTRTRNLRDLLLLSDKQLVRFSREQNKRRNHWGTTGGTARGEVASSEQKTCTGWNAIFMYI